MRMYKAFYSLKQSPFSKDLPARHLYASQSHKETLSRLKYLQQIRGIGVITGESGIGKTTYLRAFVSQLNPSLYKVVYFPLSTGTVMDFYRGIASGLGEIPQFRKVDLFHQIQQAIHKSFKDSRITPVFILDEMQLVTPKFLGELTILFNFEMDSKNPFILILSGLDYFLDKLKLNQNRPLSQRVVIRYEIEPFDETEFKAYIAHHLSLAGANIPLFDEAALNAIYQRSRGIPRVINTLCSNCLIQGSALKASLISEEIVFQVSEELCF